MGQYFLDTQYFFEPEPAQIQIFYWFKIVDPKFKLSLNHSDSYIDPDPS